MSHTCEPSAPPAEEMQVEPDAETAFDQIPYAIPIEDHRPPIEPTAVHGSYLRWWPSPAFVNSLRLGEWETPFWSCRDHKFNGFMAWCLPCFPLAQITHRIGWGNYWKVLFALLAVYAGEVLLQIYSYTPVRTTWWIHYLHL